MCLPLNQLTDVFLPRVPVPTRDVINVFIPRDFLRGLFGVYSMDLPPQFTKPDLSGLDANDTIPSNINSSAISYIGEFLSAPPAFSVSNFCATASSVYDGQAVYLHPTTTDIAGNQGWVIVEVVLIRLNPALTPSGRFPVYSNLSIPRLGSTLTIGSDAAVCLQKYEPWVIEAYNTSTGSTFALRIVENGGGSTSPSGNIRGAPIANTRYLNTTGKGNVFSIAYNLSTYQLLNANSRPNDLNSYVPTLTVGLIMPHVHHFF